MKSNKQRKLEIKTKRLKKKASLKLELKKSTLDSVDADPSKLSHNFYYSVFIGTPFKYWDKPFTCCTCGKLEVWTAKKQKWWYETAKGLLDSTAIRCKTCRIKKREEKEQQKAHMAEMAKREPHAHDAFFKKRW